MSIVDLLIRRAQRTPYYHLDGYMRRWWLVPYGRLGHGDRTKQFRGEDCLSAGAAGCGPLPWLRRPFSRLLQSLGLAIRVHHILRSDRGRYNHSHPWPYLTIILRGGYWEIMGDGKGGTREVKWRGPGSILFRRAGTFHRLILRGTAMEDGTYISKEAWTLFITGPKAGTWGFDVKGKFVPHWEYEGEV